MSKRYRIERDTLGELRVPVDAIYGAQTQRAVENFSISGLCLPGPFICALARIKSAAATVNAELGLLDTGMAAAISDVAGEIITGRHYGQFPVDVFQTGSGTSTNMNANEVIARMASMRSGLDVHPNDHVNLGQSSNDVIPSAIHISACLGIQKNLLPALEQLLVTLARRAAELSGIVKTGRTHLMDALPLRLDQELGAWHTQVEKGMQRLASGMQHLRQLPLGGTAVGTGVNAHPEFGPRIAALLSSETGIDFVINPDPFEGIATQDAAVAMSGLLKTLAVSLMKISNDLRWMNSGPLAGLGEITLPLLQPGSSIMPGKVNPVIPEAVAMACAQVIGNDMAITVAGQAGNFQLNTMLPLVAYNLLQSIDVLGGAVRALDSKAIAGFTVNRQQLVRALSGNPVHAAALNPVVGYEKTTAIARRAWTERRPVIDVAEEMTSLSRAELERLLDPVALTDNSK